jgi:hypothetical protein
MLLLRKQEAGETTKTVDGALLVQTVQENFEVYTKREILQAKEAYQAQAMIRSQIEKYYKGMVSRNIIKNCPINNKSNAQNIFGPDLASVQQKMVRRTPAPVVADYAAVPRSMVEANLIVILAAEVFFVDGTAFLLMVSRRIKFVKADHMPVRRVKCLGKHLKQVLEVYGQAGFRVRTVLLDGEFEKQNPLMSTIESITTARKELVSKAERTIRMLKERVRSLLAVQPFEHIPKRVKIEFVYFIMLWLNAFPVRTGILLKYLPQELLVRWQLD